MRAMLILSLIAVGAMHHATIREHATRLTSPGDAAAVTAALELRCGGAEPAERSRCEGDLRDAFARGTSDAGTIVRLHCTRFDNGWSESRAPSPVCATIQES